MGLLRFYQVRSGVITCYYSSLAKVAAAAELKDLGPMAEIDFDELQYYRLLASEIQAEELQRSSFYAAYVDRPEFKKKLRKRLRHFGYSPLETHLMLQEKGMTYEDLEKMEDIASQPPSNSFPPVPPDRLFVPPCDFPARVLGRNKRFLFVSEGFAGYGGSIAEVASRLNLHPVTVQRHLRNKYRLAVTPVLSRYRASRSILKRQIAYRLGRRFRPLSGRCAPSKGKFLQMRDRWFELGCNIYKPQHQLVSYRRGRRRYQKFLRERDIDK